MGLCWKGVGWAGVVLTCSLSIVPAGGPEVGGRGTSQTMGKATLVLPPCKGGEGRKRGEEGDDDRRDKDSGAVIKMYVCMYVTEHHIMLQRMVWCSSDVHMSERHRMYAHTYIHNLYIYIRKYVRRLPGSKTANA